MENAPEMYLWYLSLTDDFGLFGKVSFWVFEDR